MKQYRATRILAIIMLILFVADLVTSPCGFTMEYLIYGNFGSGSGALTRYGMLVNISEIGFQWWRPVTCIFLHAGIPHLLVNLAALLIAGPITERASGSKIFLLVFALTGIFSSAVNLFFCSWGAVGASGAIYGVIGCMFLSGSFPIRERYAPLKLIALILYLILPNLSASTAVAAHAAGIAAGALCGIALLVRRKSESLEGPCKSRLTKR